MRIYDMKGQDTDGVSWLGQTTKNFQTERKWCLIKLSAFTVHEYFWFNHTKIPPGCIRPKFNYIQNFKTFYSSKIKKKCIFFLFLLQTLSHLFRVQQYITVYSWVLCQSSYFTILCDMKINAPVSQDIITFSYM